MSLVFIESFEHWGTFHGVNGKWDTGSNFSDSTLVSAPVPTGTYVGGSNQLGYKPVAAAATYITGFATINDRDTIGSFQLRFYEGNNIHVTIGVDAQFRITATTQNGLIATSNPDAIPGRDRAFYIECKCTIDDVTGYIEVRVDGTTVLTYNGDTRHNSGAAYTDKIFYYVPGFYPYIDDIYICDTTGAVNNDFLGVCNVHCIFPDGAGAVTGLTPSAGSNYQNVDEIAPDGDTTYNYSTGANEDSYTLQNLSVTGTVYGVQVVSMARHASGDQTGRNTIRGSSGTKGSGTTRALIGTYSEFVADVFETDPDTATLWTVAGVNAMEAGYEIVAGTTGTGRVTQVAIEVLITYASTEGENRVTQVAGEALIQYDSDVGENRVTQVAGEALIQYDSDVGDSRVTQIVVEAIVGTALPAPPVPPTCLIVFSERSSIASRYFCTLEDTQGTTLALFDDWRSLAYSKLVNGIGSYRFVIDGNDSRATLFGTDHIFKVYRSVPDCGLDWYVDFVGLHRSDFWKTFQNGNIQYTGFGVSPEDLLRRRAIAYRSGDVQAEYDGPGESAMKQFVEDNMGNSASSANRFFENILGEGTYYFDGVLDGLSIEPDGGSGENWAGARAWDNLLEVLQDIANATGVDFSMTRYGLGWRFQTHTGQLGDDRTREGLNPLTGLNASGNAPFVFSVESGNVSEISYSLSRLDEANAVVAMGKGERSTRKVATMEDNVSIGASPWNRVEVTRNGSSNDTIAQLEDFASKWLFDLQYKEEFKFTPLAQPNALYGKHYFLGDRVTAEYNLPSGDRISRDKRIVGVTVTISGDVPQERIEIEYTDVP